MEELRTQHTTKEVQELVHDMQRHLVDVSILLRGAETLNLAEAEDLSNILFASAHDLSQLAGAVIAHSARKFSDLPPQFLSLSPSQDTPENFTGNAHSAYSAYPFLSTMVRCLP